jgi:hypothetical protein
MFQKGPGAQFFERWDEGEHIPPSKGLTLMCGQARHLRASLVVWLRFQVNLLKGALMSKLYRSLLWSGLIVAGVAAFGDDVTGQPQAPPILDVRSIGRAPSPIAIGPTNAMQTFQIVNADAAVAAIRWMRCTGHCATVSALGMVSEGKAGNRPKGAVLSSCALCEADPTIPGLSTDWFRLSGEPFASGTGRSRIVARESPCGVISG